MLPSPQSILPSADGREPSQELIGAATILRPLEADLVLVSTEGRPDPLIECIDPDRLTLLTERQDEVLSLLMSGMSGQEAMGKIGINQNVLARLLRGARKTLGIEDRFAVENELTDRENEVAVLGARGMAYREIAGEIRVSLPTVKTHISKIYGKLGIIRRSELAGKFEFSEEFIDLIDFSKLSSTERRTMELKSVGMSYKLIAKRLREDRDLSESTARTHAHNIYVKLPGIENDTQLAQIGRGYIRKVGGVALQVQSCIVDKLERLKKAETAGSISLANPEKVRKIENPELIEYLRDRLYISQEMAEEGVVGLIGLAAALLSRDSSIKKAMDSPLTQEIVEEVVNREVEIFLKHREKTTVTK